MYPYETLETRDFENSIDAREVLKGQRITDVICFTDANQLTHLKKVTNEIELQSKLKTEYSFQTIILFR